MSPENSPTQEGAAAARRVVLSYPEDLSAWGRSQVSTPHFQAYLRTVHDTVEPGDTWAEFVGVGCCGDSLDVPLRVKAVDGGHRVSDETDFEYEVRASCDVDGGWHVQSAAGPTE
ncbi:hypothetical protein [Halorientalis salina]|uniref:hypothetical protein n=1 Tax=Halorientalis salina TaxID=2932266 RepID=UPI0010ABC6B2|nr:hypothetical protein [Halorientalis salina]